MEPIKLNDLPKTEGGTPIMEQYGYSYDKAHLLANRKYPWEYKKTGGRTDDEIQTLINNLLKVYL